MNTAAERAARLLAAADALGAAIEEVEAMARDGSQAISDEERAADRVVVDGPDIVAALRALAMRLDRAAYVSIAREAR